MIAIALVDSPVTGQEGVPPWIYVVRPEEWVDAPPGIRPFVAMPGEPIRVTGQAFHPGGIQQVFVAGVAAEIELTEDGVANFSARVIATLGQDAVEIRIMPVSGTPFLKHFPFQIDATFDRARYARPWLRPDSMILVVGSQDTLEIRVSDPPRDAVPGRLLTWSTSNPGILRVDSTGVITPVAPGSAAISATGFDQTVTVAAVVYPRPSSVMFSPPDTVVHITVGERMVSRVDLWLGGDAWLRGIVPELELRDTLWLKPDGPGIFVAIRPGETVVQGRIAGHEHVWRVSIAPPAIRARLEYAALLAGHALPLPVARVAPDGSVLGAAVGANWRSTEGSVVRVENGVARAVGVGRSMLSASLGPAEDTTTVYVLGDLLVGGEDATGRFLATVSVDLRLTHRIGSDSLKAGDGTLAPDGRTIAFVSRARRPRIYLMDPDGRNPRRLVPEPSGGFGISTGYEEHSPKWSHDGRRIVFVTNRTGNYEVFSVARDGSGLRRLTNNSAVDWRVATAPDAPVIAFERLVGAGDADIVVIPADGSSETVFRSERATLTARISETKPFLLPGAARILYARGAPRLDERAGETLALLDLTTGNTLRDLVLPLRDHELVFTVSPDGSRIAYHQRARRGQRNNQITIIDLGGSIMATVTVEGAHDIHHLAWGAMPIATRADPVRSP